MKTFTIDDIRSWDPCYDPSKYLSEGWQGNVIDILKNKEIPFQDRLWAVLRTELISDKIIRLFVVWSYRQTLKFVENPDPRSIEAANISEEYAMGKRTKIELDVARSAAESAYYAARSAAEPAAYSAFWSARSAAWSAAEPAAYSAFWSARSAAESAAWSAAESAAESARSAAESAAESARSAARSAYSAAESSARSAQKDKLIEMILEEEKLNK